MCLSILASCLTHSSLHLWSHSQNDWSWSFRILSPWLEHLRLPGDLAGHHRDHRRTLFEFLLLCCDSATSEVRCCGRHWGDQNTNGFEKIWFRIGNTLRFYCDSHHCILSYANRNYNIWYNVHCMMIHTNTEYTEKSYAVLLKIYWKGLCIFIIRTDVWKIYTV